MNKKQLINLLNDQDFHVHLFKQDKKYCAELETWTVGGVNIIIVLMPFTIEELISYIDSFDVDENIMLHRQDKSYCTAFTLRESLEDFEAFHKRLQSVKELLS